jgi:ATPase subunit of ABC transporter with duplicated ATPase domains
VLNIRNLSMVFGQKSLFNEVNLILQPNRRYGVTGANGTGKSTFLKILAGETAPNTGSVEKLKDVNVGILKQDHFRYEAERVVDVVIQGNAPLASALSEKEKLLNSTELTENEGYRLAELEEVILHQEGYNAESVAKSLLIGLGISEKYHNSPLNALSGGFKLRVLLAQVLFQQPEVMLLDEPTNHLDIPSIEWLEDFLKTQFKGLLIFISHDREFLNNLATHILDVDYGTITDYVGNHEQFLAAKELALEQKQHSLQHKEKQIASMQHFVDRFGASATKASQAASRVKMIERIEQDMPDIKDSSVTTPHFNFGSQKMSGKSVLKVENIGKKFGATTVLKDISFNLRRGEKCAIIGPNGIGKSTLLKILLNEYAADEGKYEWGETINIGYFAQDYHGKLPQDQTIWQWLENNFDVAPQEIRSVLGQALFRGADVNKKIALLSGGESARLMLASLVLQKHNMLVFDEPTNHLDLESVNALVESLKKFHGAVLCVSHNRHFIDQIATRVIALTEYDGVRNYLGNYHDYLGRYGKDYLARTAK